ncbi:hypothetical protein Tco_0672000 [Tanacetum coccineum]
MSCSLPHTVEEIKEYVQKQCDINDVARQKAFIARQKVFIAVSKLFNKEYHVKQALNEQYAKCKDISSERRDVIKKNSQRMYERSRGQEPAEYPQVPAVYQVEGIPPPAVYQFEGIPPLVVYQVEEQVKTHKIQAGVQVSRLEDKDVTSALKAL